jgi:signal transduction histidine kinase
MLRVSTKTAAMLFGLLSVAVLGTGAVLFYALDTTNTVRRLVRDNVEEMIAAAELDTALLRQRGYVAAYMLDAHDQRWLEELDALEPAFRASIDRALAVTDTPGERTLLADAGDAFREYDAARDRVVQLCRDGDDQASRDAYLGDLDRSYRAASAAFEKILSANREEAQRAVEQSELKLQRLMYTVAASTALTFLFGGWLAWLLYSGVFAPIRRIAERAAAASGDTARPADAFRKGHVDALGSYLSALMTEVSAARSTAERRRVDDTHMERLAGLGRAVAHIAHEIRNRLALLGGYANLIGKRPEDAEGVRTKAQTIYAEALRLEKMLSEIMAYAKPVRMACVVRSINTLIEDLVRRLEGQLPENVRVRLDLGRGVPEVSIDADRIEQVMLNLIRNAAEAMPSGGVLTVSTRPRDGGLCVAVRDEGAGIPDDMREFVFTPFRTTKKDGNGLGLAICRQIVVAHRGSIDVESPVGNGTTVNVCLPAVPAL